MDAFRIGDQAVRLLNVYLNEGKQEDPDSMPDSVMLPLAAVTEENLDDYFRQYDYGTLTWNVY